MLIWLQFSTPALNNALDRKVLKVISYGMQYGKRIEELGDISPKDAFCLVSGLEYPFILSGGTQPGQRRYSYVGAEPYMVMRTDLQGTRLQGRGAPSRSLPDDPFLALAELTSTSRAEMEDELKTFPFEAGAVGYFSYDLKDFTSGRGLRRDPCKGSDSLSAMPLCHLGFYDNLFVYDHIEQSGFLLSGGRFDGTVDADLFEKLRSLLTGAIDQCSEPNASATTAGAPFSNQTRHEYELNVARALEYIAAGDIYQINLSHLLEAPWSGDPFALYLSLLDKRPARFSSYLDCGEFQIISNTPERFLKVESGVVETEPIKGTRPRGEGGGEDAALIEELRTSVKERAEHVMIVDLERSDLGRVSETGTVEVVDFERVESFPMLHHMTSTVRGRLKPGLTGIDALRAAFPGGSITGAPKIRAMEIIDEIEPSARGIYTGAIGYVCHGGDMDLAMAIRTAVYDGARLYVQVGSGIVADSIPAAEYEETILKARDFLDLLGLDASLLSAGTETLKTIARGRA